MDTIQLQCGSCRQMMGIQAAHLGQQVRCPHCQAIVQTPAARPAPRPPQPEEPPPPEFPSMESGERESIFAQSEPPDDLFGNSEVPRIEMPPEEPPLAPPVERPPSSYAATVTMEAAEAPQYLGADAPLRSEADEPEEPTGAQEAMPAVVPRNMPRKSMFLPILLIFLIPYAIFTTAFIGYLLYLASTQEHPLKRLPDPSPKGAPRMRISHDADLPSDMRTTFGKPYRVGAIEITPLQVTQTAAGDLTLEFKARNVSDDQIFTPLADEYLRYLPTSKPYTFLERQHATADYPRVYGGTIDWFKGRPGKDQLFDGELSPGEEATVRLTSEAKYRSRLVPSMVNAAERLLWRIQVRRGFVEVDGRNVSATAVVGIDFAPQEIKREQEAPAEDDV